MEQLTPTPDTIQRPRLSDFSFFGFDEQTPDLQRQVQRVEIRGGPPGVEIVDDYIYVPMEQTARLRRERETLVSAPSASVAEAPAVTVEEDVVYLGWLFGHYGHFLMQSLARVWYLTEVDPSVKVIFHAANPEQARPTAWAQRMLTAFGVPPERILTLDAPARIRRLIVPEPLFAPRSVADDQTVRAHEAMAEPYRAVAESMAGDVRPSAQPVYLSRRRLPSSQRLIVGEGLLEEALEQQGFRIAYPETMTFEDQVRLINSHDDIFSNAGSAAQNVLFALHRPGLHLLTNGAQFSPDYFMHRTLVGSPTTFINGLSTGGRANYSQARKLTPHMVDMPTCMAYLEQRGFLTTPPPPLTPDRGEALQAEYDEAWLYGYVRIAGRRAALPVEIEQEATRLAARSWPLSLALARYFVRQDASRVDGLASQFAALAAAEHDPERLRRYRREVVDMASHVARRCSPPTASLVNTVVTERFPLG